MPITKEVLEETSCVEALFEQELQKWKDGKHKVKLLILGEAPTACKKYFYGEKRGNYLSALRKHYGVSLDELLQTLRKKGILGIEIYQYALPSEVYKKDKSYGLYNPVFLKKRITDLKNLGLIDESTKVVYRYQNLIDRNLVSDATLSPATHLIVNNKKVRLLENERGEQRISKEVLSIL